MKGLEALKSLKHIYYYDENINNGENINIDLDTICKEELDTIEKELKESEKQTQILKILKEKKVDVLIMATCKTWKEYNNWFIREQFKLTKKEFDLLKEWLKNDK